MRIFWRTRLNLLGQKESKRIKTNQFNQIKTQHKHQRNILDNTWLELGLLPEYYRNPGDHAGNVSRTLTECFGNPQGVIRVLPG